MSRLGAEIFSRVWENLKTEPLYFTILIWHHYTDLPLELLDISVKKTFFLWLYNLISCVKKFIYFNLINVFAVGN